MALQCIVCDGTGKIPSIGMINRLCPSCDGTGKNRTVIQESKVPAQQEVKEYKKRGRKPNVSRETS